MRAPLMKRELELFMDSVFRGDAPVTSADRRLQLPQRIARDALRHRLGEGQPVPARRAAAIRRRYGLLGKGAVLMVTAYPNRTAPVLRGAWILERVLGTPPARAAAERRRS